MACYNSSGRPRPKLGRSLARAGLTTKLCRGRDLRGLEGDGHKQHSPPSNLGRDLGGLVLGASERAAQRGPNGGVSGT